LIHPRCAASVQEYKDGIAYALKQFDLPNVVQYIDAGNGNWLGWDPNVGKHQSSLCVRMGEIIWDFDSQVFLLIS
jgi:cellulase/cellobiase CelA1